MLFIIMSNVMQPVSSSISETFVLNKLQHVHVHILPRKPGDFERNDDIYDKASCAFLFAFSIYRYQGVKL